MTINHYDGRYCLFFWLDANGNGESDEKEYSDDRDELEQRAKQVLAAGRYKYIWMGVLNDARQGSSDPWDFLEEFRGPSETNRVSS